MEPIRLSSANGAPPPPAERAAASRRLAQPRAPPIPCPPNRDGSYSAPVAVLSPPPRARSGSGSLVRRADVADPCPGEQSPSAVPRVVARLSSLYHAATADRRSAWSLLRAAGWSVLRRDEPPEASEGAQVVYHFICRPATPRLLQRLCRYGGLQRVNHLPRSEMICDKRSLALLLNYLLRRGPAHIWDWYPQTCASLEEWREAMRDPVCRRDVWVVKPDHGWGGKGLEVVPADQVNVGCFADGCVVQRYVSPGSVLLDGCKFDVRLYVLVTSLSPLRIYAGTDGLVRVCCMPFGEPGRDGNDLKKHVTNRKLNAGDGSYVAGDEAGMTGNNRGYAALRAAGVLCRDFWKRCHSVVLRTIFAFLPFALDALSGSGGDGRMCFELLAYDFTLAADGEPLLCEVNQRPSFSLRDPWLRRMKIRLLRDMIALLRESEGPCPGSSDPARPDPFFERIWPHRGPSAEDMQAQTAAAKELAPTVRTLDQRRRTDSFALEATLYPERVAQHRQSPTDAAPEPDGVRSGDESGGGI
eukprot:TRINITY_DN24868_c0_g1_i2.p1 TRINITY_DN24868_c0_g1~~TRINITY_DN24868_c0_g1_i2.p1  ORF type:complete len:553 (+),score=179.84 TRINITY_DN24868_c0_g1_i2:76-1659(+)